ncbi:PAS-domain containing protein [Ascidiaceihabitans sp.]|uniref:PAS-domain containing protein n=1 Tax=Ascidiaceihabitans sp. TaxID=1872644 RepID=UPI003299DF54
MPHTRSDTQTLTAAGLNLIGQALTIYDHDLKLAVCNAPFQQMFNLPDKLVTPGATFEETIHHLATLGEYGPVDDVDDFVRERAEVARAFHPHYMERTRANGRTISVEGSPLPNGGWVTVYTDITPSKQQEALLRARSEELSDQVLAHAEELASTNRALAATVGALEETKRHLTDLEARTRLTTEMMPAHIAHVSKGGHYTFSNNRLSGIVPGRPSDILGHHIADILGPFIYARIEDQLALAYAGQDALTEFTDVDSARRIRVAFAPDANGGAYILSTDVTEETQARVALQQSRRRALAAQLTSGLAHDFSNLLTIILGLQSKLARMGTLPDDAHPLVEGTMAAAKRGGQLLGSIADMTGQRIPRPRATHLESLLQDLQTLTEPTLPHGVTLSIHNAGPQSPVLVDPGAVQDSLVNLILNARDACGAAGEITLNVETVQDTWIDFTVSDTGSGFSDAALEQAFDPFFSTKGSEGSGLGLPMVYDITKLAGGDVRVRNTAKGGAAVHMRLPLRYSPSTQGGLALLVEDNSALRDLYREMLMNLRFSVIEATSVDEAVALVADLPDIALVLSDIRLEGQATGLDLADRLKAAQIPVILMTSLPISDPLHQTAQKCAPVLCKPFDEAALKILLTPKAAT